MPAALFAETTGRARSSATGTMDQQQNGRQDRVFESRWCVRFEADRLVGDVDLAQEVGLDRLAHGLQQAIGYRRVDGEHT